MTDTERRVLAELLARVIGGRTGASTRELVAALGYRDCEKRNCEVARAVDVLLRDSLIVWDRGGWALTGDGLKAAGGYGG